MDWKPRERMPTQRSVNIHELRLAFAECLGTNRDRGQKWDSRGPLAPDLSRDRPIGDLLIVGQK